MPRKLQQWNGMRWVDSVLNDMPLGVGIRNNIDAGVSIRLVDDNSYISGISSSNVTEPIKHGSQTFYALLEEMSETHNKKSHDYASNSNPSGNYHFAGQMALMFSHSPEDAGFVGRIAEKLYRIKNLESSGKEGVTETIEDTERDICVITALWIADRRDRRARRKELTAAIKQKMDSREWEGFPENRETKQGGIPDPD